MKKGNLGVSLSFFAVFAFVLAICVQPLLCGLLLALVLVYEKDEWLSRQVIQAFMLSLLIALAGAVVASLRTYAMAATQMYIALAGTLATLLSGAVCIVIILAVIFAIIGITRTAKYMEAMSAA